MAAQDNPQAAVEYCTRGIQEVEAVLGVEPNHADAREHRYQLYGNRGMYRAILKEYDGAVQDWQSALDFATNDAIKPYCRSMKIRCLVEADRLDAADQETQSVDLQGMSVADQFQWGALWGCIGNALEAKGETVRSAERYDRAAEIIRNLSELGHFKEDQGARSVLLNGDDFREIRPRLSPEFLEQLAIPDPQQETK
jgi:tetratricopeptide (TPR) repeat protein